jgi:protein CpxP
MIRSLIALALAVTLVTPLPASAQNWHNRGGHYDHDRGHDRDRGDHRGGNGGAIVGGALLGLGVGALLGGALAAGLPPAAAGVLCATTPGLLCTAASGVLRLLTDQMVNFPRRYQMLLKSTCYSAVLATWLLVPAVAVPVGAMAQTQTPSAGAATTPKAKPAAKPESRADRVEQHISQLHTQLRITPAQQTAWDQFAQVMRDNAKNMNETLSQRGTTYASMNAAENMQSYAQIAEVHAQDTQKLAAAFQTLYGSMSDEQKKNADAVFRARSERAVQHHKGNK